MFVKIIIAIIILCHGGFVALTLVRDPTRDLH